MRKSHHTLSSDGRELRTQMPDAQEADAAQQQVQGDESTRSTTMEDRFANWGSD